MRLRIGLDGRILGFLPLHGTLIAADVPQTYLVGIGWLCSAIDGQRVNWGVVVGKAFATLT